MTNKNGEELYILIIQFTTMIRPSITVGTWTECKKRLESIVKEVDNSKFSFKPMYKKIDEENHTAEASVRCSRKDCNDIYFKYTSMHLFIQKFENEDKCELNI
jgi:hypothetical protein|nr:MAG TPA: hypothetical protein [Crassvirales sp.]